MTDNIKLLGEKLRQKQEKYRYWQHVQENLKYAHNTYDSYDYPYINEWDYQMTIQRCISGNKMILKDLENEIKELRKQIKSLQRNLNNERA